MLIERGQISAMMKTYIPRTEQCDDDIITPIEFEHFLRYIYTVADDEYNIIPYLHWTDRGDSIAT